MRSFFTEIGKLTLFSFLITSFTLVSRAEENLGAPSLSVWSSGILTDVGPFAELSATSSSSNVTFTWEGFNPGDNPVTVTEPGWYYVEAENAGGEVSRDSIRVYRVPNAIWYEDFDNLYDGIDFHAGQAGWDGQVSGVGGCFNVVNRAYQGNNLGIEAIWKSEAINIKFYTNVGVSTNLASTDNLEPGEDYIMVYYKLDGGPEVPLDNGVFHGSFSPVMATASGLAGKYLEIVIKVFNNGSSESYYFDNVIVTADAGDLPDSLIWKETFNGTPDFTTASSQFSRDISGGSIGSVGYFEARQHRFLCRQLNGEMVLKSEQIAISDFSSVSISVDLFGYGKMESGEDYLKAYYKLDDTEEVLFGGINGDVPIPVTASLEGISGNTLQFVLKTNNNSSNERHIIDNMFVKALGDDLEITETIDGTITCMDTAVQLGVTANYTDVTYLWEGPGGFTSAAQNPLVTIAGEYVVTVTRVSEQVSDTVYVDEDVTGPGVSLSVSGAITCSDPSVQIISTVLSSNASYVWTGPGNFSSTVPSPFVSTIGTYNLTVTDNNNGCSSTASVQVQKNVTPPLYSAYVLGQVTCIAPAQLIGFSPYSYVSFSWTGPNNFSSNQRTAQVFEPGTYFLTVTNENNGCQLTVPPLEVFENKTNPIALAALSDSLTCVNGTVDISGASSLSGVSFKWDGPNGFTSSTQDIQVDQPGQYILTITDPDNGCTDSDTVEVIRKDETPDVTTNISGQLTCTVSSVTIQSTSSVPSAFSWSGPNGFSSTSQNISVNSAGTYELTVTGAIPECATVTSVDVIENTQSPDLSAMADSLITCSNTSVSLIAESAASNTVITWTGFPEGQETVVVTEPGNYLVTARDSTNGCFTERSVLVESDEELPVFTASSDGALNCTRQQTILTAETVASDISFTWTGFQEGQNPVSVTGPGTYIVVATDTLNGCTQDRQIVVEQNIEIPNLIASADSIINCGNNEVTLNAVSTGQKVVFQWETFAEGTNPVTVTSGGNYVVTVTDTTNGCSSADTVFVNENFDAPLLELSGGGLLNCTTTSLTLAASSPGTSILYQWAMKNGDFTSTNSSIMVMDSGLYYIEIINTQNGCSSLDSIQVTKDVEVPEIQLSASDTITCDQPAVNILSSVSSSDAGYTWRGPNGYFSMAASPSVTVAGNYNVTVRDISSGCISRDTIAVRADLTRPLYSVYVLNDITCTTPFADLIGFSPSQEVSFLWEGPNSFTSTDRSISVGFSGSYFLTVTNELNGCEIEVPPLEVLQDTVPPDVTASVSGSLSCSVGSVTLTGNSTVAGATYLWQGPNTFTSGSKTVVVDQAGPYILTVTDPVNGCTNADTVEVLNVAELPVLELSADSILTCTNNFVTVSGTSSVPGIFSWSGPDGFSSDEESFQVSVPGTYTLTVIGAVPECSSTASLEVEIDTLAPDLSASPDSILTCTYTEVTLTAVSSSSDVSFTWTGFGPGLNPVAVTTPGAYEVIATDTLNGCTSQQTVNVEIDTLAPDLSASADSILTCSYTEVTLTAVSSSSDVSFTWTGFGPGLNPVVVTTPGAYEVIATDTLNGCTTEQTVNVDIDTLAPDLSAFADSILTCTNTSVTLTGVSTSPDVSFTWTGFGAGLNPVVVTTPGAYDVIATDTLNGCTTEQTVNVDIDTLAPDLNASVDTILTCAKTEVTLTAASTSSRIQFSWDGFPDDLNPIVVSAPGEYRVVVTDTVNGCFKEQVVTVEQDTIPPAVIIEVPDTITCSLTSVILTPIVDVPDADYFWVGASSFSSNDSIVEVSNPGFYKLRVFNSINGCETTDSVEVFSNTTLPDLSASSDGDLTCAKTETTLTASTTTPNTSFTWIGFSEGLNPVVVTGPGEYIVIVTDTINDCVSEESVMVERDVTAPDLSTSDDGVISCNNPTVDLIASSSTPTVRFAWDGFTAGLNPVTANSPGNYQVVATDTLNGCTTADTVSVSLNITTPGINAFADGMLSCNQNEVVLTAESGTASVRFKWSGFGDGLNPVTVMEPGSYSVSATDTINGCTSGTSVTVQIDTVTADLSIDVDTIITCSNSEVILTASSGSPRVRFDWFGFAPGTNPVTASAAGDYLVVATDTVNGCTTELSATVLEDKTPPSVSIAPPNPISCLQDFSILSASSDVPDAEFIWTGPNSFSSNAATTFAFFQGMYTVTVRNPNTGCTNMGSVQVMENTVLPNVTAVSDGKITCAKSQVELTAASITPSVEFKWGGFDLGINPVLVNTADSYTVTARDTINGCTSTFTVIVEEDLQDPVFDASADGSITCADPNVELIAFSDNQHLTYSWTGFPLEQNPVTVTEVGNYLVVATDTINGCTSDLTLNVSELTAPPSVVAGQPDTLDCITFEVDLSVTTDAINPEYSWKGPNSFSSSLESPTVTLQGTYIITVTDLNTGCEASDTIEVTKDVTPPSAVASASGDLNCINSFVLLSGATDAASAAFNWSGPNSFTSNSENTVVVFPGDFILRVTNEANGCMSRDTVRVNLDRTAPNLSTVSQSNNINCRFPQVQLTASSTTPDVVFTWTTFTAGDNPVFISSPGDYEVVATDTVNGCTTRDTLNIGFDITSPNLSTSADGIITCVNPDVQLQANSSTPNVTFKWSGAAPGINPISVTLAGTYNVTATNEVNGCTSNQSISVVASLDEPDLVAGPDGVLTCDNPSVTLTASSGVATTVFNWSGFPSRQNAVETSDGGSYDIVATDTTNGCFSELTVQVEESTDAPDLTTSGDAAITCGTPQPSLEASSMTPNTSFTWSGFGDGVNPVAASAPGQYIVTATNADNGCTSSDTVSVGLDIGSPGCSLSIGNNTTLPGLTQDTISTTFVANYSYQWSITSADTSWVMLSGQTSSELIFQVGNTGSTAVIKVTVIDENNGCNAPCSVNLSSGTTFARQSGQVVVEEEFCDWKHAAYPSPSNGEVTISFTSPVRGPAMVRVFNTSGAIVAGLFEGEVEEGRNYEVKFNKDHEIPSGIYFYVITTSDVVIMDRLIITK